MSIPIQALYCNQDNYGKALPPSSDKNDTAGSANAPYFPIISPILNIKNQGFPVAQDSPPTSSAFPRIYRSVQEIKHMLEVRKSHGAGGLKELPKDKKGLKELLLKADENGQIIWANKNNMASLYRLIQRKINASSKDVHLVIGYNHEIEGHIIFFNELISLGKDDRKLFGITHLALEMYGSSGIEMYKGRERRAADIPIILEEWKKMAKSEWNIEKQKDIFRPGLQNFIDYYLENKDSGISGKLIEFLQDYIRITTNINNKACYDDHIKTLRIAKNQYKVIASELSMAERRKLSDSGVGDDKKLYYGAREAFAADYTALSLDPDGKDVVMYFWGLEHSEKEGLPKHISYSCNNNCNVISIALNGGQYDQKVYFDRALKELGGKWMNSAFALILEGTREADIIIHLPIPEEREPITYINPREEAPLINLR